MTPQDDGGGSVVSQSLGSRHPREPIILPSPLDLAKCVRPQGASSDEGREGTRLAEPALRSLSRQGSHVREKCELARPWHIDLVLVLAIAAVSSAGGVFKYMADAAPVTRAGWRLQATSIAMVPAAVFQWRQFPAELRKQLSEKSTLYILLGSGCCLAVHFGLWVWSLDHTSLPHSLLFVCSPPLLIVIVQLLQGICPSCSESGGVGLGVIGAIVLAATKHTDREAGLLGDLAALGAAAAFVGYITAGKHCRAWMPLFLYALPVTAIAAFLLILGGVMLEGWGVTFSGQVSGAFGWLSAKFILPTLYLALGPGIVGHAGLNAVLRYMSPLGVSMAVCVEPVLGSAIGWALGVSTAPGWGTWVGGILLIVAVVLVNWAAEGREEQVVDARAMALTGTPLKTIVDDEISLSPKSQHLGPTPNLIPTLTEDGEVDTEERALLSSERV